MQVHCLRFRWRFRLLTHFLSQPPVTRVITRRLSNVTSYLQPLSPAPLFLASVALRNARPLSLASLRLSRSKISLHLFASPLLLPSHLLQHLRLNNRRTLSSTPSLLPLRQILAFPFAFSVQHPRCRTSSFL